MTEDITTGAQESAPETKDQLVATMQEAITTGDFKTIAIVARKIDKLTQAEEKTELEAKQAVVAELTTEVYEAINKVVTKFYDAGKLDNADGVWYTNDFEENLRTCKLLKKAIKAKSGGGGGGGKKVDVSTEQMLSEYGDQIEEKSGKSFKELWDADTGKNSRFKVRVKLLKIANL